MTGIETVMKYLYWTFSHLLQILAILLCLLGLISVLYPIVLLSGSIIAIAAFVLLLTFPYTASEADRPQPSDATRPKRNFWVYQVRKFKTTRRIFRALLVSVFAMIFSFGYMGVLKLYSWLFYIEPMSRELEPYRKLYREGQKEFRPLAPGLESERSKNTSVGGTL